MNFRCYNCGVVMGEGLPPMEALSLDQMEAVGAMPSTPINYDVLEGTRFDGMSPHSFCTFCLLSIAEFPLAMDAKGNMPGHEMRFMQDDWRNHTPYYMGCECGHAENPHPVKHMVHTVINRQMVLHLIHVLYSEANTTELESILFNEF